MHPIPKGKWADWEVSIETWLEGSTKGRPKASPQARLEGQGIPADTYQLVNDFPLAGVRIGSGCGEVKKEKGALAGERRHGRGDQTLTEGSLSSLSGFIALLVVLVVVFLALKLLALVLRGF